MRISTRINHTDPGHTHLSIWVDGSRIGEVIVATKDFEAFTSRLGVLPVNLDKRIVEGRVDCDHADPEMCALVHPGGPRALPY